MRNAIREQLLKFVPELKDVYEPHVAGPDVDKPYAVIRQGIDTEENDWMGFRRIIEVWPYVSRTTFIKVDDLANKIIKALNQQLLTDSRTGEAFSCIYQGNVGPDVVDHEWDVITRGLRFSVLALQHVEQPEIIKSDPWITALSNWTKELLDESWTIYENQLPLGYKRPCVLWRLDNYRVTGISRALFEVEKSVVGHVISQYANQKIETATRIIERLVNDIKIPLKVDERRYMTVVQPRGDFRADGLNNGQITLSLRRKTSRLKEESPMIEKIYTRFVVGGE